MPRSSWGRVGSVLRWLWSGADPVSGAREIQRFSDDLAEDLIREAKETRRPIAHVHHAAEAMVTVAFSLGASSIDLPHEKRLAVIERIIIEVRMIMRGAQAVAETLR